MNKLHIQFGAAISAAPLFVLLYNSIFEDQAFDVNLLDSDIQSLFFLIVFYPVVEEFAFRGVIQEYIAATEGSVEDFTLNEMTHIA